MEPREARVAYDQASAAMQGRRWEEAERRFLEYAAASTSRAADGFAGAGRARLHLRGPTELGITTSTPWVSPEDRARAAAHYGEALRRDPNHARALAGLARTLPADDPERVALLERAAEASPDYGREIAVMIGDARRARGEFEAARDAYELAMRHRPREPLAYERMAGLLRDAGHEADANRLRRAVARAMSERFGPAGKPTSVRRRRKGQADLPVPEGPVWCVLANVKERCHAPSSEHAGRTGTKHFAPGAKVYVLEPMWGDGVENVEVIGHHRRGHRFLSIIVRTRYLENARARLVYSPHVNRELRGERDGSEASKARCEELARWINARDG